MFFLYAWPRSLPSPSSPRQSSPSCSTRALSLSPPAPCSASSDGGYLQLLRGPKALKAKGPEHRSGPLITENRQPRTYTSRYSPSTVPSSAGASPSGAASPSGPKPSGRRQRPAGRIPPQPAFWSASRQRCTRCPAASPAEASLARLSRSPWRPPVDFRADVGRDLVAGFAHRLLGRVGQRVGRVAHLDLLAAACGPPRRAPRPRAASSRSLPATGPSPPGS